MIPETNYQAFFDENFEGLNLLDVMQILSWSKATSIISIESDAISGHVYFLDGEVVHAETDKEKGLQAFFIFVQHDHEPIRIESAKGKPKNITIFEPFGKLMRDSIQYFDEYQLDKLDPPAQDVEPKQAEKDQQTEIENATQVTKPSSEKTGLARYDLYRLCKVITRMKSDILGCSIIDLENDIPLGIYRRVNNEAADSVVNTIVKSVMALYRTREQDPMAITLTEDEGTRENVLEELYFRVGNAGHFMDAIPGRNILVVLAMSASKSMGMGWVNLRRVLVMVEEKIATLEPS